MLEKQFRECLRLWQPYYSKDLVGLVDKPDRPFTTSCFHTQLLRLLTGLLPRQLLTTNVDFLLPTSFSSCFTIYASCIFFELSLATFS